MLKKYLNILLLFHSLLVDFVSLQNCNEKQYSVNIERKSTRRNIILSYISIITMTAWSFRTIVGTPQVDYVQDSEKVEVKTAFR
jgi:hypothetical protein